VNESHGKSDRGSKRANGCQNRLHWHPHRTRQLLLFGRAAELHSNCNTLAAIRREYLTTSSMHDEDRMVRTQERFDARFNDGHITKAEQRALNQDENGISRQIGR
jgi:hypothetical protein